jgi:hypothetical protein
MNYEEARYDMFWGYGARSLQHWIDNPTLLQESLDTIALRINDTGLDCYVRANYICPPSQTTIFRQSKYKKEVTVNAILERVPTPCFECGMYIFDRGYSASQAPSFFINFHASRNGTIAGRTLHMPEKSRIAETFFLFAVETKISSAIRIEEAALEVCNKLELGFAYRFENVAYDYDGKTLLEWAYKNHSARLRSGMLKDFIPERGIRMARI